MLLIFQQEFSFSQKIIIIAQGTVCDIEILSECVWSNIQNGFMDTGKGGVERNFISLAKTNFKLLALFHIGAQGTQNFIPGTRINILVLLLFILTFFHNKSFTRNKFWIVIRNTKVYIPVCIKRPHKIIADGKICN